MPRYRITLEVEVEHEADLPWLIRDLSDAVEERDGSSHIGKVPIEKADPQFRVIEGGGQR